MDEPELIRRIKNGEIELFDKIVEKYKWKIYKTAWRILRSKEDAEDVVQDCFIRAFKSINSFRGDSSISTWLYRISVNMSINLFLKRKKISTVELNENISFSSNPEKEYKRNRLREDVKIAMLSLPPRQRAIFSLRFYENMKFSEISKILGLSQGAVKASYHHAISKLKEKLKRWIHEM